MNNILKISWTAVLISVSLVSQLATSTQATAFYLPDLQGRYVGEKSTSSGKTQIVAQVPAYQYAPGTAAIEFRVFETRASSRGDLVRLAFAGGRTVTLSLNGTQIAQGSLAQLAGHCVSTAQASTQNVRICFDTGKLDFETTGQAGAFAIHLSRGDTLPPAPENSDQARTYGLDELVGRARFQSYAVSQEAERVYQAREGIKVARGELLPKLSLRAIVGIFTGDYLSVVGSALPFLFPSNWFHWKASKAMFEGERKSFASLRGNQMNTVEGLFYFIQRDQAVLAEVTKHVQWMKTTQAGLLKEEQAGVPSRLTGPL